MDRLKSMAFATLAILPSSCGVPPDVFEADRRAPTSVTLDQLAKAYEENEAAAQSNYGAKRLFVSATIDGIKLDSDDRPFINLTGGGILPAQLKLAEAYQHEAQELAVGQQVVFDCLKLSEMLGTPMLSECRVAGKNPIPD